MKAVLAFVCVLVVAHVSALTSPPCPTTSLAPPNNARIQPFYKYSYQMPKSAATSSLYIDVDSNARSTQGLWFRATADASTAITADLHVKLTINRAAGLNDTEWALCSLTTGSCTQAATFGLVSSQWNITMGDKIWLSFFPQCSGCSETVEFSVETAWYFSGSTTNYPDIMLINNTRTMVFSDGVGAYTPFYYSTTAGSTIYTSVVYDNKAVTGSAELVLYWTKDWGYNGTGGYVDTYPAGDGGITGPYLTQRPFTANETGTWYLTAYIKTAGTANANAEWTIKVGFNGVPCSSGSVLSISVFLAILPFLASLWN